MIKILDLGCQKVKLHDGFKISHFGVDGDHAYIVADVNPHEPVCFASFVVTTGSHPSMKKLGDVTIMGRAFAIYYGPWHGELTDEDKTMTVGVLRDMVKDCPDDTPIRIWYGNRLVDIENVQVSRVVDIFGRRD